MKVIAVFVLLIAIAAAFPSTENQADAKSESQQKQQNTILLIEGSLRAGNGEIGARRNKRFLSIALPNLFDPLSVPNINIDVSPDIVQKLFVSPPPTSIDSKSAAIRVEDPFVDVSVDR